MDLGPRSDVIVVGGGVIGLATAVAIAEQGGRVLLIAWPSAGEASPAAAGLLVPSLESATGPAHDFALAARDRYPSYIEWLAERTGIAVPFDRSGVLEVAIDQADEARIRDTLPATASWIDGPSLAVVEPALESCVGAALHPTDGWVDNAILLRALRQLSATHSGIRHLMEPASALTVRGDVADVSTASGQHAASAIVLAAGAWVAHLAGVPRPLPVEPVRGQMVSLSRSVLSHAVYGPRGYLVPRADGRTLVGATMEHVGFDASTTAGAIDSLTRAAAELCPSLAGLPVLDAWAGLRPVTPDLLPILGRDPEHSSLIYACGHSRNGILMAPLTADCVARLALAQESPYDLSVFSVTRFDG